MVAVAGLLAATVNQYGYERDELYFRVLSSHPAWGYVDEPPLTPLLVRAGVALFGDNLWAPRVPAALCALAVILLTVLLVRELGGTAVAQTLAAVGMSSTFVLVSGHALLTASPDLVAWLLVILFAVRALQRAQPRWWLAAGLAVGLGLYNKQLIVLLLIGLAAGLLIAGPRRELASPWLWAGVGIAVVVGLPNLIFQIAHHWPEQTMARAIARDKGSDDRTFLLPFQFVLIGVTVAPIWIAGLIRLLRDPRWRAIRAVTWAYPVVFVLVLITGGQGYYTFGLLAYLFAAGCVVTVGWATGHRGRWAWTWAAAAVSVLTGVVIALPLIPARSLPDVIGQINQADRDSVGWPEYVRQVAAVYGSLPAADRGRTTLVAGNYGEQGALDRYGPRYGLPTAYGGLNELYRLGPPPASATVAVTVGEDLSRWFDDCAQATTLDSGLPVSNEEQGVPVTVCHGRREPWNTIWPALRHYG
ncbi:glycosyltransferase family 39 protein [Rugosimonospora acidiphila]|uniref:Glycosyltransferase family 39 protein n=2 Tax=Rugosimonospora acidiphila TaxID=556531 RepID=A0ABP9RIJ3_9ACTN